jgi:hypothetical protein
MPSFQRLRVYQRAIEFLALVNEIVAQLARGGSYSERQRRETTFKSTPPSMTTSTTKSTFVCSP